MLRDKRMDHAQQVAYAAIQQVALDLADKLTEMDENTADGYLDPITASIYADLISFLQRPCLPGCPLPLRQNASPFTIVYIDDPHNHQKTSA